MFSDLLNNDWRKELENEFSKDYFIRLVEFYSLEKNTFKVFPPENKIFASLNLTSIDKIKVIIIGQDPYHGIGQANGLCFSVSDGIKKPPSLLNIFKELQTDLGFSIPESGNLESWAKQGVLLLNTTLTVREGSPASHANKGWEFFTDKIIKTLSNKKEGLIFLLWGNHAHTKEKLIDDSKHLILKAAHPSPLAKGAFFGCKHFSKTNSHLIQLGKSPIDWEIKDMDLFNQRQTDI
jgi:uracil-DNA glycosylase